MYQQKIIPIVSHNGTHGEGIEERHETSINALGVVLEALSKNITRER